MMRRSPLKQSTSTTKQRKSSRCKICRGEYVKKSMMHKVCGEACAIELALIQRAKDEAKAARAERIEHRAKVDASRPRKWHMAKLKTELHAFIRERDEGRTCISCETVLVKLGRVGGDYDAGHFRSVGSASNMRFLENNIHGQCKHCNDFLGGNPHAYELGLISRYGQDYVDVLKADNEIRKYTIPDLIGMTKFYKLKRKELRASRSE